ncbi:MAG: rhomboid family intramembrane serine protease [Candidatus Saliniplasma sp.]
MIQWIWNLHFISAIVLVIILVGFLVVMNSEFYFTQIMLIVNLSVFILVNIIGIRYPYIYFRAIQDLAGKAVYLQTGENLHTFLTLMFLHGNIGHILGNMVILFFIGMALESRIGKKWTAIIYLSGGLIATMGQYIVIWGSEVPNLGASGAVMGLMGAIVYLYPKDKIPMFLVFILLPEVRVDLAVGAFLLMQGAMVFLVPAGVAHAAHFAGFAGGMVIAYLIKKADLIERDKESESIDHKKLKKLVTDEETEEIYKKIKEADDGVVQKAWIEHLLSKAECPECGKELKGESCECGFDVWED